MVLSILAYLAFIPTAYAARRRYTTARPTHRSPALSAHLRRKLSQRGDAVSRRRIGREQIVQTTAGELGVTMNMHAAARLRPASPFGTWCAALSIFTRAEANRIGSAAMRTPKDGMLPKLLPVRPPYIRDASIHCRRASKPSARSREKPRLK